MRFSPQDTFFYWRLKQITSWVILIVLSTIRLVQIEFLSIAERYASTLPMYVRFDPKKGVLLIALFNRMFDAFYDI